MAKAKLAADRLVRPHNIEVATHNGEVTVTGNIDSQEAKERS
jgi:osmotically-inducible protein OsmY